MRITICQRDGVVYEHELAHAWARAALDDEDRAAFMAARGHTVWNDHDVPWNERATEDLAMIIQQGLAGLPLPPVLGDEWTSRMQAFEMMTGRVPPVLDVWLSERSVPCSSRPTPASRLLPDVGGRRCDAPWG